MIEPIPPEKTKILLVEGPIDRLSIVYLMEHNGVEWPKENPPVHITVCGGYKEIIKPKTISTILKRSNLETFGILIDADQDFESRWQSIQSACLPKVTDLPKFAEPEGLIHAYSVTPERQVPFGIWVMPDNQRPGMLETWLKELIEDGDPLWEYAQEATQIARTQKQATFIEEHLEKAQICTWLAWQKPPGLHLHLAVKKKLFNPQHPRAQAFVTWFKKLYDL